MTTPEQLAVFHLETAVALKGRAFVEQWLGGTPVVAPPVATTGMRGRKPGAAPAEIRCTWPLPSGESCKNKRLDGKEYCGLHQSKVTQIDLGQ